MRGDFHLMAMTVLVGIAAVAMIGRFVLAVMEHRHRFGPKRGRK